LTLSAVASKFLAVWLGFLLAILLIIIIGCCSVGRAWRIGRHKALYICVRMFGESGASGKELHLVSSADAASKSVCRQI
jgi:hypothetical protein